VTVPEIERAPELASVAVVEHALDVLVQALAAAHPTLIDDFARARDDDRVVSLAHALCCRVAGLEALLRRYRRAVGDRVEPLPLDGDDGLF
jgi:hypothetical protein